MFETFTTSTVLSGTETITVDSSDNVGVVKVDLYIDNLYAGTDSTSPFLFSIDTTTLSNGNHLLTAIAYDRNGNQNTTSINVDVENTIVSGGGGGSDTTAPTVSITSPSNSATISGTQTVSISASDNVAVTKVEFYLDGALAATDTVAPYAFSIDTTKLSNAAHTFIVKAYDAANNIGTTSISVTVNNAVVSYLYDDFSSGSYSLADGQTSPNGKWYDHYNGFGSSGVSNGVFNEQPAVSTSSGVTHADLTTSTQSWHNYKLSLDMRTNQQLRTGSTPNNWETAWVMFNYGDDWHHYYFVLKDSGAELGKKDNNQQLEQQIFLATPSTPSVAIGQWQHVDIQIVNNVITVWVNGIQIIQVTDTTQSSTLANSGHIGLYNEDSSVSFDNVYVQPLP